MKRLAIALFCLGLSGGVVLAQDNPGAESVIPAPAQQPANLKEKASYLLGFDFVQSLKQQQADLDLDQVMVGMKAAMEGKEIDMTPEEMRTVMMAFERQCQEKMVKALQAQAEENKSAGEAYLKTNGAKEGVTSLPSGVQYRVVTGGAGETPTVESKVKVHYTGKTIDGKVFDSSVERGEPAEFPVGGLIKGMTEVLQKMKVGDKWEVSIPSGLAYGENAPPQIGPNQVLIFELELLEILK
jgi:FKBP-type peptidyl-prolyl cis-trans isomerase